MPYVVYKDDANSKKVTVMKFDGSNWVVVGGKGLSAGQADYTRIAIDANNNPYVAYNDYSNSYKATVKKFNGSSWETIGTAGFSAGSANYVSLVLNSAGVPYVAYSDGGSNGKKVTVMYYNGTAWSAVGSAAFTAGQSDYVSLAATGSSLYVAYKDWGNSYKASVMKYSESTTPVTLLSFEGSVKNNMATIQWISGVEENFKNYIVEKSIDGITFTQEGTVEAGGSNHTYQYQIPQTENTVFYRLAMVDNDGSQKYSDVISLSQKTLTKGLMIYPNPAKNYIYVTASVCRLMKNV